MRWSRSRRYCWSSVSRSAGSNGAVDLRLVEHFQLGDLRLVEVARLGDGRLLRVGDRLGVDAGVGILLREAFHRELERRLQRLVIGHCSVPFRTQVVLPTVTVRSVKKFQRTYAGWPGAAATCAAQLRVVAERQPHDAGAVAVVRNPRRPLGNGEQRVEAQPDFAERAPRVAGLAASRPRPRPVPLAAVISTTRPFAKRSFSPSTGRPSHCDGGNAMTPSTVSSSGATRTTPAGSSIS